MLSKLVKDFTNISTSMLSVEKFHVEVVGGMKKDLEGLFKEVNPADYINNIEEFFNNCI